MISKNRDSKFIIYQVLYIFVITVLALKGADLDLSRVVSKEEAVEVSVRDSLVALIDSLYALGLNFDIKINENAVEENVELKEQLSMLNKKMQNLTEQIKEIPPEERVPEKPESKELMIKQSPINMAQTFIQNTWNKARNTGDVPSYIYDSRDRNKLLAVIQPGEEKQFDLTDQNEVIVKFGSQEDRIRVVPNKPPEIKIERATTKMTGSDIYVRDLQRITVFTVKIIDERPDQLKITHSGPISVTGPLKDTKGNLTYNVSLNVAANQSRFDEWADRNDALREPDGKYKANFFFIVTDERSKDRVQVGDSFFFTDFSK